MKPVTIGNATLYNADCLDVMREMGEGEVDCVVTDPPYGLGDRWTGGTWFTKNVYKNDKVEWDNKPPQEIIEMILKKYNNIILWGGNYFNLPPSRCWLVWNKTNTMPTMADVELAWTNFDKPSKKYSSSRNGWIRQHPTEKPVGLIKWCITNYTNPGDTIFDPFAGSGTTGVACMQTDRKFIGVELDSDYFEITCKRIRDAAAQPTLWSATNG